jgi:hypothetical protein
MNLFSLHGKWFSDNENRLTSTLLYFLSDFRDEVLSNFLGKIFPETKTNKITLKKTIINFQPYDDGKFPDAEIILDGRIRILIEAKINNNTIQENQIANYLDRLIKSSQEFPEFFLLIITQTDQKIHSQNLVNLIKLKNQYPSLEKQIICVQWKEILKLLIEIKLKTKDKVLYKLLSMFIEEVGYTLYNKIVIEDYKVKDLSEVVIATQNKQFSKMALENNVFWPYANITPSQYVGYYFIKEIDSNLSMNLAYIAKIKFLFHNVTIAEVLDSIEDFNDFNINDLKTFKTRALEIFNLNDPKTFPIAITEKPIKLPRKIPYLHSDQKKWKPNIIPGWTTTISKLFLANELEDLG